MMKSKTNPFLFKQSEINWYSWKFEKINSMQWFFDVLINQLNQTAWNGMHQMDL